MEAKKIKFHLVLYCNIRIQIIYSLSIVVIIIGAVDARTKKRVSADYELKNGDIIKIMAR
ncbi:MAG: hypothetical protein V1818_00965 [Candidatus Aenigmatarchaeota archaeon]